MRVPRHLGVVVGVHIDETRRDHLAGCVDPPAGRLVEAAHRHDPTLADPDIGPTAGRARAVYDLASDDRQIEHGAPF